MRRFHYVIATTLGLGYSPIAPGTAGSIFALLVAFFVFNGNTILLIMASVVGTVIGTFSADYVEVNSGSEDPSIVVIDEVAGMWISLLGVPTTPWLYLVAFGLFRLIDIIKPFPVNSLQNIHGGWGIMLDDIAAGIYTLITMQILLLLV